MDLNTALKIAHSHDGPKTDAQRKCAIASLQYWRRIWIQLGHRGSARHAHRAAKHLIGMGDLNKRDDHA